MTKKHFEGIAEAIHDAISSYDERAISSTTYEMIDNIADFCQTQNANFDRQRFMEATGRKDMS